MSSPTGLANDALNCGAGGGASSLTGLRVASIFIIWTGSTFGALFPVLAKRTSWLAVPHALFEFAKYFGSGVIIATAFIHLLDPAIEALRSPCLSDAWHNYPYALALALLSIFFIFIVELLAFRIGTAKLKKLGISHDAHGHGVGAHSAHGPEGNPEGSRATVDADTEPEISVDDIESVNKHKGEQLEEVRHHHDDHHHGEGDHDDSAAAQVIGVGILEFGVILHSVLIGLTLAVDESFKVLFVVITFHQLFEGLGIGSRLANLRMPARLNWVPIAAALLYGMTTPLGIAVGLGVRTTYNPGSAQASAVSGVLDALSAGILIYTGLVELLAHEFLFSREMREASNGKLAYALGCMLAGCALMALLGKWA